MEKIISSTTFIPLQQPYQIIKYCNNIGMQIGIQRVIYTDASTFKLEVHDYPVVSVESSNSALDDEKKSYEKSTRPEVWSNVEMKNVSVLCEAGKELTWKEFIKILWYDFYRLGKPTEKIEKNPIYKTISKHNKSRILPEPGGYTIHLHTESVAGLPTAVRSREDDIFALNVEWEDDLEVLEQRLEGDLLEYLLIISPNRTAKWWQMTYQTDEECLRPLVEKLNANSSTKSFSGSLMTTFSVRCIMPYEKSDNKNDKKNTPFQKSPRRKIGRAKAPAFEEYVMTDAPEGLMEVLEEMLRGKTGKAAFTIILAATGVWINEPKDKSVCNRFPSVKEQAYWSARCKHYGINLFLNKGKPIPEEELEKVRNEIRKRLKERAEKL